MKRDKNMQSIYDSWLTSWKALISSYVARFLIFVGVFLTYGGRIYAELEFGQCTNLGPQYNTGYNEGAPRERFDGLEMFTGSDRPGGQGHYDIYVATRPTTSDDWGPLSNLGGYINSSRYDSTPCLSPDGLELYFASERNGGQGSVDIWMTKRSSIDASWGWPTNLGIYVNSPDWDAVPWISPDGLSLYFESERPEGIGQADIWVATRPSVYTYWGTPTNLGIPFNSEWDDVTPSISPDGLVLLFTSDRGGSWDIWMATRPTTSYFWGYPVILGPRVNSMSTDGWPSISADGSTLYFTSRRSDGYGHADAWKARIFYEPTCGDQDHPYPPGDVNQDCRVDWLDIAVICSHWLEDYNPCPTCPLSVEEGPDPGVLPPWVGW